LIFSPPNAPVYPRAIFHATCGPVHASVTTPVWSSTRPVATSPALPDQTFTVQVPCLNVASVAAGAVGLGIVALTITYLFSLYANFQRREVAARDARRARGRTALRHHAAGDVRRLRE